MAIAQPATRMVATRKCKRPRAVQVLFSNGIVQALITFGTDWRFRALTTSGQTLVGAQIGNVLGSHLGRAIADGNPLVQLGASTILGPLLRKMDLSREVAHQRRAALTARRCWISMVTAIALLAWPSSPSAQPIADHVSQQGGNTKGTPYPPLTTVDGLISFGCIRWRALLSEAHVTDQIVKDGERYRLYKVHGFVIATRARELEVVDDVRAPIGTLLDSKLLDSRAAKVIGFRELFGDPSKIENGVIIYESVRYEISFVRIKTQADKVIELHWFCN